MNVDLFPFERDFGYWFMLGLVGSVLLVVTAFYLWPRFAVFVDDEEGYKWVKSNIDKKHPQIIKRRKKRRRIALITGGITILIAIVLAIGGFTGRIAAMQDLEHQESIARIGEEINRTLAEPLSEDDVTKLVDGGSVAVDVVDENDVVHNVKFKYNAGSAMFGTTQFRADETIDGFVTAGVPWTETAEIQKVRMFRHETATKLESRYNITLPVENRKELEIPSERPSESFKKYGSTELIISDEYTGYKRVGTFLIWEGEFKLISDSPDGSNLAEMNKQGSSVTFLN